MLGKQKTKSPVTKAPKELWPGKRDAREDVTVFFRRNWARFIPLGLTLIHILPHDPKLFHAVRTYETVTGKPWPPDLRLSTEISRLNKAEIRLKLEGFDAVSPGELIAIGRRRLHRDNPRPRPRRKLPAASVSPG